jgi:CRISPR-associated protein Cas2
MPTRRSCGNDAEGNGCYVLVLITYDVSTVTPEGCKRLTRVAKACLDYGQRVQNSVFECDVDPAQWAALKQRLLDTFKASEDSLRFYYLGANWRRRIEHHGTKKSLDPQGPLIV